MSELDAEFLQCLLLDIYNEQGKHLTAEQQHDILYAVGLIEARMTVQAGRVDKPTLPGV